jgi:hypothetical protein
VMRTDDEYTGIMCNLLTGILRSKSDTGRF